MKLSRAIEIMDGYQKWRRGGIACIPYTSKDIGDALDEVSRVCRKIENFNNLKTKK